MMKGSHFFEKRKKEMAKQEKAKQKADRKAQRKAGKGREGGDGSNIEGFGETGEMSGGTDEHGAPFRQASQDAIQSGTQQGTGPADGDSKASSGPESQGSVGSAPSQPRT